MWRRQISLKPSYFSDTQIKAILLLVCWLEYLPSEHETIWKGINEVKLIFKKYNLSSQCI